MKEKDKINNDYKTRNMDKLYDELTEVKILLKSWLVGIKIIGISGSLILVILAFFGYNKIESIENNILERANIRLKKTDEILSKIDEKKINEINKRLIEKKDEYDKTLSNFDKIISQNRELEKRLIEKLPTNPVSDFITPHQSFVRPYHGYFTINNIPDAIRQDEALYIYLSLTENIQYKNIKALAVQLVNNDHWIKFSRYYKPKEKINKMVIIFTVEKGNYQLQIGLYAQDGKGNFTFYHYDKNIRIQ